MAESREKLASRTIVDSIRPGASLAGSSYADVGAAGSLPWVRLGIDPDIASRVIVDIALLWLAWSLRKNRTCLAGMLIAILGFSVLFRGAYTGALRHEGVLFFLFVSLCWIACIEPGENSTRRGRRAIAFGMLPLLITQTLTLPVLARRIFVLPNSRQASRRRVSQRPDVNRQRALPPSSLASPVDNLLTKNS